MEGTSAAAEAEQQRTQWPTNSIFFTPAHIRSGRESNFEPKLVSIGPYYHGQENLRRMEDLKLRCFRELRQKQVFIVQNHSRHLEAGIPQRRYRSLYNVPVEPSSQGGTGIDDLPLDKFIDSGERALAFYKQEFNHSTCNFVQMLFLDSCFIIRTILYLSQQVEKFMTFLDVHIKDVRSDLLLLENQIPLFFINEVYEFFFPQRFRTFRSFNDALEPIISLDMPWRINHDAIAMSTKAVHLLDLYWRCSWSPWMYMELSELERDLSEQERHHSEQGQASWEEINELSNTTPMVIANATELQKTAGIEFEKFKEKDHLDVTFSKRCGIMRMPRLKMDSRQTILLINLIAFENCIFPSMRTISSYMKLMDALIDSEKDVQLLQKCGVIYNTLSSHEMAATFFNDIGNFCFINNNRNHFSGLYMDVQKFYGSSWHRRWASLRQKYFNSPWAIISVVAAVILLVFSAIQTVFTVLGYFFK